MVSPVQPQGQAVVAGGGAAPASGDQPDTMYFHRGASPERVSTGGGTPSGPTPSSAPAEEGVAVPSSSAPAQEAAAPAASAPSSVPATQPAPVVAPGRAAPVATQESGGGGRTVAFVVGGIAIVAIIVVVVFTVL